MESRLLARTNKITNTSGLSPTYLQANLLILPSAHAKSFHDLCRRNPVSCPLLAITPPGSPHTLQPPQTIHSPDFDIRTDCPAYRIYKHGKCIAQRRDILDLWTDTDDYVGFLIGCSFSFEDALGCAGLKPRHQETGAVVPMYRTNLPLLPAGVFTGATCIVSMRPYRAEDVERVRDVTRRFLATHGEPVAWGWEGMRELGIEDIGKPDFGEEPVIREGEVPVFWVCFPSLTSFIIMLRNLGLRRHATSSSGIRWR